jgi:predicted RNA methylase
MKIDIDTLAVLSRCRPEPGRLYIGAQLDRKDYLKMKTVIEAMGGRWNRKAQCHLFDEPDVASQLETVLATGVTTTAKDLGFFRTQGKALEHLMHLARIEAGDRVLEPSAGEGDIVARILESGAAHCTAIEIDTGRAAKVMARRDPGGCELMTLVADFLEVPPPASQDRRFQRVVMNPPFALPGRPRADLDHVEHALKWLAPGGRLVAIMSSGVTFRQDARTRRFNELVDDFEHGWTDLPDDAFKASGTGVRTVILTIDMDPV